MRKPSLALITILSLVIFLSAVAHSDERNEEVKIAKEFTSPTLGAKFVRIPAGTFTMGSPSSERGRTINETQHQVTISKPFYMQTTTVTQGQWKAIMGNNPSNFSSCGDDCPVEKVSWNDVQDFIGKLNQREGTDKYRFPTEAEWEYAARAGTKTPFNTGDCLPRTRLITTVIIHTPAVPRENTDKKPSAWRASPRMPGVFTICMAMSGSGVRTGMVVIRQAV